VIYSYNKTNKMHQFLKIYCWSRTLHVSNSFSEHYQESSTVHTAIGLCHTDFADCLPQQNLCDIYLLLCVQCQTPGEGQRNCPEHVEFCSKNKFEKLAHLVGFVIRIRIERAATCLIQFTPEKDALVVNEQKTARSLVTVWKLSEDRNISCASLTSNCSSTVIQPVA